MSRIAVSGFIRAVDGIDRTGVNVGYVAHVAEAGGIPLVLSPAIGAGRAAEALDGCAGLLLSGGADIEPARYGAAPSPALGKVDAARDAFEFALLDAALAQGDPRARHLSRNAVGERRVRWHALAGSPLGAGRRKVRHEQAAARSVRTHDVRLEPGTRTAGRWASSRSTQTRCITRRYASWEWGCVPLDGRRMASSKRWSRTILRAGWSRCSGTRRTCPSEGRTTGLFRAFLAAAGARG